MPSIQTLDLVSIETSVKILWLCVKLSFIDCFSFSQIQPLNLYDLKPLDSFSCKQRLCLMGHQTFAGKFKIEEV